LKRSGKIPADKDLLHIWANGELMKGEHICISLVEIPSHPEGFLVLSDCIMFSISLVEMDFKLIFGKGFLKNCIKW